MITTTKEKIAVMQAYDDGKYVQVKTTDGMWIDAPVPNWNWMACEYRIKPEVPKPTYTQYKSTDEMIADFNERFNTNNPDYTKPLIWVRGKYTGAETLITRYIANKVFIEGISHDMEQLFKNFEYLDGSQCGKLV